MLHFPGGCLGTPDVLPRLKLMEPKILNIPAIPHAEPTLSLGSPGGFLVLPQHRASPFQRKGRTSPILSALLAFPRDGAPQGQGHGGQQTLQGTTTAWEASGEAQPVLCCHTSGTPQFLKVSKGTEAAPGRRPGVKGWRAGVIPPEAPHGVAGLGVKNPWGSAQ